MITVIASPDEEWHISLLEAHRASGETETAFQDCWRDSREKAVNVRPGDWTFADIIRIMENERGWVINSREFTEVNY
jgi:aspartokinase-like uncharacterized kinase